MDQLIQRQSSSLIVTIEEEALEPCFTKLKPNWIEFLRQYKPLGVVFYSRHFKNKLQAKRMIDNIVEILGQNCFLAVDQEGGRVQRLYLANENEWYNCPSAEELANKFVRISQQDGEENAKKQIIAEYSIMFREMSELGLNMVFGPNCDLNFYSDTENYKQCELYRKILSKAKEELNEEEKEIFLEASLFNDFTNFYFIKMRKLIKKQEDIIMNEKKWLDIQVKAKDLSLLDKFQNLLPYSSYINVIGTRSYGRDPELVAKMAQIYIETAELYRIICVPKHILGHGRPLSDTHIDEAYTDATEEELLSSDLIPYIRLHQKDNLFLPFAMVSHVIYKSIGPINIGVQSQKVMNLFEKTVKKKIIFISDDLKMAGAKIYFDKNISNQDFPQKKCDILLSGNHLPLEETKNIAENNVLGKDLLKRLEEIWEFIQKIRKNRQ